MSNKADCRHRAPRRATLFISSVVFLGACTPASDEDRLRNTLDLFRSNGMTITAELENRVTQYDVQIGSESEFIETVSQLGQRIRDVNLDCKTSASSSDEQEKMRLDVQTARNDLHALQVVTFFRRWQQNTPIEFPELDTACLDLLSDKRAKDERASYSNLIPNMA